MRYRLKEGYLLNQSNLFLLGTQHDVQVESYRNLEEMRETVL